jgi:hypothetical protein
VDQSTNLLMQLFRILTPEEIYELTTISEGAEKNSLTSLIFNALGCDVGDKEINDGVTEDTGETSNIIPFPVVGDREAPAGQDEGFVTDKKGVVFILDIKEKMSNSQRALKSKEIISLYKKTP